MSSLHEEAVKLSQFGKSIFPLLPRDKKPYADLLPKDENGKPTWTPYQTERADEAQIAAWWATQPNANIALATGAVSGEFVVDVDGDEGVAELNKHGKMPRTPVGKTGSGWHIHFKHPGFAVPNRVKFLPGLDTRGDGGYIVVAPSIHPSGSAYYWLVPFDAAPLADCPDWLLDLLKPKAEPPRPLIYRPPVNPNDQDIVDLAHRALNAIDPARRDNYGDWVEIGMSLSELGSIGLSLWESWSAGSSKYKAGECARKWNTFKPRQGHTIGYLFFCADQDAGRSWRPVREMPRYAEKIQIIEQVQAKDAEYPNGLPVAVRGAINAYAPASAGPLLELIVEATAQGIIPRGSPISFECLEYAAVRTGRGVSIHTIRAGLKAATDPHGVEFLRILSHYNNISIDSVNTDQCDEILKNPCRCPGRPAILYDLLPWSTILTNIARAAVAPILQKVFPADNPLVAPIRAECLAGLGREDVDTLADELDARYGKLITAQPGYKKAMGRANAEFNKLARDLANPQAAPIPAGWTYRNSSEYMSCCERAIIEAAGGETQYSRRKNAALIGCTERNLSAVYKGAGVTVEKDQLADVVITSPDQLKPSIDSPWHDDLQGYAIAFVSSKSKRVKPIDDPEAQTWALGQIEVGAVVSVRYRQANKQTIATEGQPQKEKPEPKAEPAPEPAEKDEPQPRLLEVEPPAPPTIAQRYARQMRIKLLILWYAEHRRLNWAEANVGKLVSLASPVKVEGAKAVDTSTGEIGLFDVQLSLDMLLNQPPDVVAKPLQPEPAPIWTDDDIAWIAAELGGTITNVVETGSDTAPPASLAMEDQQSWRSLSQSSPLAIGQPPPSLPLPMAS